MLPKEKFVEVIKNTPLVSIDLLVENAKGEVLLGLRNNRPAHGFWFAPGGRILKGETLAQAFARLTLTEIGHAVSINDAQHHGLYEHFYSDNVFANEVAYSTISTHYIVNAFKIKLATSAQLPLNQHSQWRWQAPAELLHDPQVHEHTKWYFR